MTSIPDNKSSSPDVRLERRHAGNTPYRMLDAWRGFAALWVVMFHICDTNSSGQFGQLASTPPYSFFFWGRLGVTMFFVISGYCIANAAVRALNKPNPIGPYLQARWRRIYPPYFLVSVLTVAASTLLGILVKHHLLKGSALSAINFFHHGLRYYVATLTLTQVPLNVQPMNVVFWTLCYEAVFYLIVAAAMLVVSRAARPERILDALNLVTIGSLIWLNLAGESCPFPWDFWPEFGLGVLVYQMLANPGRRGPIIVFSLCFALMALFAVRFSYGYALDRPTSRVQAVFCLAFTFGLLALFPWDQVLTRLRLTRFFSWLGLFSYSLYLVHELAIGVVSQIIKRLHVIESHFLLIFLAEVTLAIAAGKVFFFFCERPFMNTRQKKVEIASSHASGKITEARVNS